MLGLPVSQCITTCVHMYSEYALPIYLFPRAVITLRVKSHWLMFELLYDLMVLIQQAHGHLISAATVCPPTVPVNSVSHKLTTGLL